MADVLARSFDVSMKRLSRVLRTQVRYHLEPKVMNIGAGVLSQQRQTKVHVRSMYHSSYALVNEHRHGKTLF